MKKYLFIVLLVGVWSCDIDSNNEEPSLIGEWEYYDYSYSLTKKWSHTIDLHNISEEMDSCYRAIQHRNMIEQNNSFVITADSVFIYSLYPSENPEISRRLIFSNDTLFNFYGDNDTIRFNLSENLTLFNFIERFPCPENPAVEIDRHYRRRY